jgi:adenylate cyclase class 2
MREIEVKAKLKDRKNVEARLKELGGELSLPSRQEDVIYNHKDANVYELGKSEGAVVRIRKSNGKCLLTLKKNVTSELDCIEHETEISDPAEMHNLLSELSFIPIVEVKKERSKCKVGDYEICLDQVDELGEFIEVE